MYSLAVETTFAASHQLKGYKGKCAKLHGHTWRVRLTVQGDELNQVGMLVDFADLKKNLLESTDRLDHQHLNDLPPFDTINSTSENLARILAEEMAGKLPGGVRVTAVTVWENERCSATYHQ